MENQVSDIPVEKSRRWRGKWGLLVLAACAGVLVFVGGRSYWGWRQGGILKEWGRRNVTLEWEPSEVTLPWLENVVMWCWNLYDRNNTVFFHETKYVGQPVLRLVGAFDFSDRDLANVAWFPGVKEVRCVGGTITDQGAGALCSLGQLTKLQISKNRIMDAGLRSLCGISSLEELDLCETEVSDAGVMELVRLPRLKVVRLQGTGVTPLGAARLVKGKGGLQVSVSPLR